MGQSDLIYATIAYMGVCNTAYWWVNYGTNGLPVELWLTPDKANLTHTGRENVPRKGYDYRPEGMGN